MDAFIALWDAIAQLASRQHGFVTRTQLLAVGVAPSTICSWIERGRLIAVHRGVYAVGYPRVEPVALAMAAVLAGGRRTLLSHDSTLALFGLRRWPVTPEITSPRHIRRAGIRAHRSTTLTVADRTLWLGVPTTRVARAIADMGPRLAEGQRIRLVNDARLKHVLGDDEARRLLGHDRRPTRSRGEDELWRWFSDRGFDPLPLTDVVVNGHEVDAVFVEEKVIVELDHAATHSDPLTVRRDRAHDRSDRDLGYRTERYTVGDLTAAEAERLKRILAARRPSGSAPPPPPGPPAC